MSDHVYKGSTGVFIQGSVSNASKLCADRRTNDCWQSSPVGSDLDRRGQPSHLAAVENIDDEDHPDPDPAPPGWDASEVKDCKPSVLLRDNTAYKRFKKTQKVVI